MIVLFAEKYNATVIDISIKQGGQGIFIGKKFYFIHELKCLFILYRFLAIKLGSDQVK